MSTNRILNSLSLSDLIRVKLEKEIPLEEITIDKKEVNEGSFGILHLGKWRDKTVAIKELKYHLQLNEKYVDAFKAEIVIMEKINELHHPNILTYFGYSILIGQMIIITEYMPIGDLKSYIDKNKKFDYPQCFTLILALASGLSALHNMDIVHLDFKTGNILLDDKLNPKIADFGCARLLKAGEVLQDDTKNIGDTYSYPPEARKKPPLWEQKSDVFCFAMTMWEMMTWTLIQDIDTEDLPSKNIKPYEELLQTTGSPLIPLIHSCWATIPKDRLSMPEVMQELKKLSPSN